MRSVCTLDQPCRPRADDFATTVVIGVMVLTVRSLRRWRWFKRERLALGGQTG